jgi:membrane fusion protein
MGFVKDGDEIILRYDAFPYELYGQRRGRVSEIATTALTQNEVPFVVGLDNQEARFRVRAVLDEQSFDVDGIAHALSPGTSFDGTILVGKRRISALLLPPGRN